MPFVTHGRYDVGDSLEMVAGRAQGARILQAFSERSYQKRQPLREVTQWLQGSGRSS